MRFQPLLLFTFSALLAVWGCNTTKTDCTAFHTGTFQDEFLPDTVATYVRTDSTATESVPVMGRVARFALRWKDPCTYLLFDREMVQGTSGHTWSPQDTLTIHILDVSSNSCTYETTSNFSDMKLQGRQVIPGR